MTQKELLYVEDAMGHEKSIISIVTETNYHKLNSLKQHSFIISQFCRSGIQARCSYCAVTACG